LAIHRGHNQGSISERRDKNGNVTGYRAQILLPDGKRRSFSAKTKKEAQRKIDEAKAALLQGRLLSSKSQTVGKYLDGWLKTIKLAVKSRTYSSYELNVRRLKQHLGSIRLDSLEGAHVQECYNTLAASGLAPLTVRQIHMTLHKALHDAMRLNLVVRNVSDLATLPRVERNERPWYTVEELDQLFAATAGDRFHALWVVLGTAGLRLGEALGLRWSDVDWNRQHLTIRRALQRQRNGEGLIFVEPKSHRSKRTVELSQEAVRAFRAHQERQTFEKRALGEAWQEQDLIFASEIGTPLEQGRVHRHWVKAVETAAVPHHRIHDLRHSVATHLTMAGMGPLEVARVLGHSNASLVLEVYGHVAPASHRKAADLMDALLSSQRESAVSG
jgi:integrase